MIVAIPYEVQEIVRNESSFTGKSIRRLIIEKLKGETAGKVCSRELLANLRKLDEIQRLPRNWNGNGASRIPKKLVNKAKSLVMSLETQPQVFPTANNSIQIEYDGSDGSYLEFQISKKKELEYYRVDKQGSEFSGSIPYSSYMVEKIVKEFNG